MRKSFDIGGSAPAKSKIKLIGPEGHLIGETEATSAGGWKIYGVEFEPGHHAVHARVRTPAGALVCSEDITIDVETPGELALQAEERERALALYERTVESFAAGHGIDTETIKEVCALAEMSIDQFIADVQMTTRDPKSVQVHVDFTLDLFAAYAASIATHIRVGNVAESQRLATQLVCEIDQSKESIREKFEEI